MIAGAQIVSLQLYPKSILLELIASQIQTLRDSARLLIEQCASSEDHLQLNIYRVFERVWGEFLIEFLIEFLTEFLIE